MAKHRRRAHLRQGQPVAASTVTTRGQAVSDPDGTAASLARSRYAASAASRMYSDRFPLGPSASSGLASLPAEFSEAMTRAADKTGLRHDYLIHDYWLIRTLHALHQRMPGDGVITNKTLQGSQMTGGRQIGVWSFGGGTALTSAWRFVRRYSEDLDGILFVARAEREPTSEQAQACRIVSGWAIADPDTTEAGTEGHRVRATTIDVGGVPDYIKFETSIVKARPDDMVMSCEVQSLIGRFAEPSLRRDHPELGGFALPCISPAWTAVNKLDALHRRAAEHNLIKLTGRGRDLYDLWAIAEHPEHAEDVRHRVSGLWRAASGGLGRPPTPRPAGGYSASPAFTDGTAANRALRDGYEAAVASTVWGNKPTFESAVEAACSLDMI